LESAEMLMKDLLQTIPQKGEVIWIGLRPGRNTPTKIVTEVGAEKGQGLDGDRFSGTPESKRQVTFVQEEHLSVIGGIMEKEIDPAILRRNIMVKGINLLALHNQKFQVGDVIFKGTGYCHPCSKMEIALGPGGYNSMRGHGGITARILNSGVLKVGDSVSLLVD